MQRHHILCLTNSSANHTFLYSFPSPMCYVTPSTFQRKHQAWVVNWGRTYLRSFFLGEKKKSSGRFLISLRNILHWTIRTVLCVKIFHSVGTYLLLLSLCSSASGWFILNALFKRLTFPGVWALLSGHTQWSKALRMTCWGLGGIEKDIRGDFTHWPCIYWQQECEAHT